MLKMLRALPFFRLLAIAKTVLLVRRHLRRLDGGDRRRLAELVRRGRSMSPAEREELRRVLAKLEPRAFAAAAADTFSPVHVPRWVKRRMEG
jgi:hypothetical protein